MTFWKKNKPPNYHPGADRPRACCGVCLWRPEYAEAERHVSAADRCCSGEAPAQNAAESNTPDKVETEPTQTPQKTPEPSDDPQTGESAQANTEQPEYVSPEEIQASATGEYEEVGGMLIDTGTGKDKYQTDPVPEGKPIPVEPEDVEIGDAAYTCTLSISCATILTIWTSATRKRWSWSRPTAGSCNP